MNHIKQTIATLMISILCIGNINAVAEDTVIAVTSNMTNTDLSTGIALVAGMCTVAATVNCIYLAHKEEAQNVKDAVQKTIFTYCVGAAALITVLCMTDPQANDNVVKSTTEMVETAFNKAYEETINIVTKYCLN